MREIVRTNDPVLISAIEALLNGGGIPHLVFDRNMSIVEGSLGFLPQRILVAEESEAMHGSCCKMPALATNCAPMPADHRALTDDAMLGGRLRLLQPKRGHRFGHDAVLLAASVPAKAKDHAIEFGGGVGAASLALLARVRGVRVTMIEIDPALSELAAQNIARNGFAQSARAIVLNAGAAARAFAAKGLTSGSADHVFMNPPFNDETRPSPDRVKSRRACCVPAAVEKLGRGGHAPSSRGWHTHAIWRADGLPSVLEALSKNTDRFRSCRCMARTAAPPSA